MQLNKGVDNLVLFSQFGMALCLPVCTGQTSPVSTWEIRFLWDLERSRGWNSPQLLKGLLLMGFYGACLDHSAPCHHFSHTNVVGEGCDALLGLCHQDSSNRRWSLLLHTSWKNTAWDFLECKCSGSRIHPFPPENCLLSRPKNY